MSKSTTITNHLNTDRVIEINISGHKYVAFTMMYRNIILIDATNKDNAILLINKICPNREALSNEIDGIILKASKANDYEDFVSEMDTFIYLNDITNNDTTKEISEVYKIIAEDYNL